MKTNNEEQKSFVEITRKTKVVKAVIKSICLKDKGGDITVNSFPYLFRNEFSIEVDSIDDLKTIEKWFHKNYQNIKVKIVTPMEVHSGFVCVFSMSINFESKGEASFYFPSNEITTVPNPNYKKPLTVEEKQEGVKKALIEYVQRPDIVIVESTIVPHYDDNQTKMDDWVNGIVIPKYIGCTITLKIKNK